MFESECKNDVFVTKWLNTRGNYAGFDKNFKLVTGCLNFNVKNEYNFVQILIHIDKKKEFTNNVLLHFREKIDKIEYNDQLANLRTQSQIEVNDVVNNKIRGLSVFVYLKYESDLKGFESFLSFNKTYFYIYDVVLSNSLLQRYFEKEKRNDIGFLKYGYIRENKVLACDQLPNHRVCSFDIEVVSNDLSNVPNGAGHGDMIVAVSFVIGMVNPTGEICKEREIVYLLWPHEKNPNLNSNPLRSYLYFFNEKDLIQAICNFFSKELDTPFLIGYNILNFDLPLILNRMVYWGIAKVYYSINEINQMITGLKFPLPCCERFQVVDLMIYLKKMHGVEYSSFSLNNVSMQDLNVNKLDISFTDLNSFYKTRSHCHNFSQKLCDYVVRDSELTLKIYGKKQVHKSLFPLINVCFADTIDYTSNISSKIITCFLKVMFPAQGLCSFYTQQNTETDYSESDLIKNTGDMFKSIDEKQYRGATVLSTSRMIIADKDVSVLDFSSLYPSIIMSYNLWKHYVIENFNPSQYSKEVVSEFLNRTNKMERYYTLKRSFSKSPLAIIIEYLIHQRKQSKNKNLNYAYKLLANSIYGLLASKGKMRHLPSAALVTSYGRQVHKLVKCFIENKLNLKVVYGDTDSFFIVHPRNFNMDLAHILNNFLRDELSLETISLTLDYESVTTVFLAEKKSYLMKLKNGTIKVVGLAKRINPKFKSYCSEFLKYLLDLIHEHFKNKTIFNDKFELLIKTFFHNILVNTPIADYMFVYNAKPYYEYKSLSSINAICSFRRNLLGADVNFSTVGELFLSYVLPVCHSDYLKRKKSDCVEFWDRIQEMNLPVDRVECLKKIFNFIPNLEKHILKTENIFSNYLEQIRKEEIRNISRSITLQKNIWLPKKIVQHCKVKFYYDDLFKKLSEYNLHFWELRKMKNHFNTVINVGSCGVLSHVTGENFTLNGLKNFLQRHKNIKYLNVLLYPTSSFLVSSNDQLVWFLSLLYNRPDNYNIHSNVHYTPENRLIIFDENNVRIFNA